MTQSPITVTYTLEEVLGQIQQQLVQLNNKVDQQSKQMDELRQEIMAEVTAVKIHVIQSESELKGEIKALKAEVKEIGKRLDTQEFINRSVVVGFVLAVVAGIVKLFLPSFPPV
jgi:septal ring factor EnvC (AmiA/AmiB activator)